MPEILGFLLHGSHFFTNLLETYTIKMYRLHLSFLTKNETKRDLIVEQMDNGFKGRGEKNEKRGVEKRGKER